MKPVIILALWLPSTILLIVFCMMFLIRYSSKSSNKNVNLSSNNDVYKSITVASITPAPNVVSPKQDIRITTLKNFLIDHNSPLADYTEELVKQSDLQGISYTLLPAMAMQESNGCKKIPEDSYNCWGFGIYGDQVVRFNSYPEAITQVAKTIKEAYIKKGSSVPTLLEDKWTPSSRGQWSYGVNFFIGKILEYEKNTSAT